MKVKCTVCGLFWPASGMREKDERRNGAQKAAYGKKAEQQMNLRGEISIDCRSNWL